MEKVALIKTAGYGREEISKNVEKIFNYFGCAGNFFKKGELVLIKPNLLFARSASEHVTTHPEVVYALCSILSDIGCKIIIGDSPGFGNAVTVAKKCGIYDAVSKFNVEFVNFEKSVEIKAGRENAIFKKFEVADEIVKADKVVNLAKLKSHAQMVLTMSVKNMFGAVVGLLKPQWHFKAGVDADFFARMLIELNLAIKPAFSIIDAVTAMEGNGPANGKPREVGALIGGTNCVAIDTIAAAILKINSGDFYTGRCAQKMKLPGATLADIQVEGGCVSDFKIDKFELPNIMHIQWPIFDFLRRALRRFSVPSPVYKKNSCRFCRICFDICPARAINYKKDVAITFDLKKCIRCFCCQELCPHGAISVKKSAFDKIRGFFKK